MTTAAIQVNDGQVQLLSEGELDALADMLYEQSYDPHPLEPSVEIHLFENKLQEEEWLDFHMSPQIPI